MSEMPAVASESTAPPERADARPAATSPSPDPSTAQQPTASGSTSTDAPPLSKKAQKKLAKAAYLAERKKERRAAEKERRKEKKRLLAEKRATGELDPQEEERERERKRQKTDKAGSRTMFDARVVVDLGFDEKMTENEVKSLTSQLAYTYSANRKAERPFRSLLFTSLNGRTLARMDATNNAAYKRWVGAEWWTEGYERLWESGDNGGVAQDERAEEKLEGEDKAKPKEGAKRSKKQEPSRAPKETVVYLTADADDELTELKEGETYIIGGIVDHNRYKNLCLNKSKDHQIRSARLPIGTYLSELRTRKVLTVNQTFEILLKWVETRSWEQALYSVIPKRKFNANGRRRGGGGSSKGGDSADASGEEDGAEAAEGEDPVQGDAEQGTDGEVKVIDVAALEESADATEPALESLQDESTAMEVEEAVRK
ncbi:hypothetical protein BV20DRAFT_965273 [Pilatotrama ljubarskyi]|nr:hypothetical protein BV20DRAFT_965273 [Pilatotrama ljubarskyi]